MRERKQGAKEKRSLNFIIIKLDDHIEHGVSNDNGVRREIDSYYNLSTPRLTSLTLFQIISHVSKLTFFVPKRHTQLGSSN